MAEISGSSFSFVHAADLHLDTPFRGVHATAPGVAEALREASLDAFDAIVDLTIDRNAAFLVIAGDIYDGAERGLRAQLRFRAGLERLSMLGIATFVVHGNHDPVETGWSAITSGWPEHVTIFGSSDPTVVAVVERDGEPIANVQGVSYARPAETENLSRRLRRSAAPGFSVGVLHCNVEGSPETYAPYSPCTIDDLLATELDYLALGHIHEHQVLFGTPGVNPWIVYSGNSQARSPRRSERGAKGAVVVEVTDGAVERVEFVACDRVRFAEVEVSIEGLDDLGALEDELRRAAVEHLEASEGRSIIVRGRITGRGGIHADLTRLSSLDDLLRSLRDQASTRAPFIWWDDLFDATATELNIDEIRSRGDFSADLVAVADERFSDPDRLAAMVESVIEGAPRALQGDLRSLVSDPSWLADDAPRATRAALDALLSEES